LVGLADVDAGHRRGQNLQISAARL